MMDKSCPLHQDVMDAVCVANAFTACRSELDPLDLKFMKSVESWMHQQRPTSFRVDYDKHANWVETLFAFVDENKK